MDACGILRKNGWIEESPLAAIVLESELGLICSRCFQWPDILAPTETPNSTSSNQPQNSKAQSTRSCLTCSSGCNVNVYCSTECQRLDWGAEKSPVTPMGCHKVECEALRSCGGKNYGAKANDYARLVGRILVQQKLSETSPSQAARFYKVKTLSIWDLEKDKDPLHKLHHQESYHDDYQHFREDFGVLYGQNGIKTGKDQSEDIIKRIYDICRIYSRKIIQFDLSRGGPYPEGLAIYPNFSRFKHSCKPSLMTVFETSPLSGPLLKARLSLAKDELMAGTVAPPIKLESCTVSCLEHLQLIEVFGTNFPFLEEVKEYLGNHCFTNKCKCSNCNQKGSPKPYYDLMVAKYAIELACLSAHGMSEMNCVIAAVCECKFLSVEELRSLSQKRKPPFWPTERGDKDTKCKTCCSSNIHPSQRAVCVRCGKMFEYDASGKIDPTGPPALLQVLERAKNQDPNDPPIFECMYELNCCPNYYKLRHCERYALITIHQLLASKGNVEEEIAALKKRGHNLFDITGFLCAYYKHFAWHFWKRWDFNTIALLYYSKFFAERALPCAFASQLITIANGNFCNADDPWNETKWFSFCTRVMRERYSSKQYADRIVANTERWLQSQQYRNQCPPVYRPPIGLLDRIVLPPPTIVAANLEMSASSAGNKSPVDTNEETKQFDKKSLYDVFMGEL